MFNKCLMKGGREIFKVNLNYCNIILSVEVILNEKIISDRDMKKVVFKEDSFCNFFR